VQPPLGEEELCVDTHRPLGFAAGLGLDAGQEPAVDVDVQLAGEAFEAGA
jgi:hypothetical protein